jgi:Domain of unknown function (DUF3883)
MNLDFTKFSSYEKSVLAGLYLSKFDSKGLKFLGFSSFTEAFNVIGLALSTKPASIKNYRDEFDPFFPNARQGWRKRQMQDDRRKIYEAFKELPLEPLADFLRLAIYENHDADLLRESVAKESGDETENTFAKRLITGLAAEHYFETLQPKLPEFKEYTLENTTRLGCGYDFRLARKSDDSFLAVEVKGLQSRTGSLALTPKEYDVASSLSDRFFLFVVKNFRELPSHDIYRNPLSSSLKFTRKERVVVQVSWSTTI